MGWRPLFVNTATRLTAACTGMRAVSEMDDVRQATVSGEPISLQPAQSWSRRRKLQAVPELSSAGYVEGLQRRREVVIYELQMTRSSAQTVKEYQQHALG